jgi:uncharacterized protein (TIGR02145 family)
MKKNSTFFLLCTVLVFFYTMSIRVSAQTAIGGNSPDPSAMLDVQSNSKGVLLPRMTTVERNAIASPANGLMIYNSENNCWEINLGTNSSPVWQNIICLGSIASLDCAGASLTGTLQPNTPAMAVSVSVPYTGGNGGVHQGQTVTSTVVTGLTATLTAGNFASGAGSLTYNISGSTTTSGQATFALNIGGQTCTLTVQVQQAGCGAYLASGNTDWKVFSCHNLGADTNADPFTPDWKLNGNYYQWGRNPTCFGKDDTDGTNPCSSPVYGAAGPWGNTTMEDNAGTISGWGTMAAENGAWDDNDKTTDDPCPPGFRVPTNDQWTKVLANNNITPVGTWIPSTTNYQTGKMFGSGLFLPAAGYRDSENNNNAVLALRGSHGLYWSSSVLSTNAYYLFFSSTTQNTNFFTRTRGFPIRCIAQ